MTCRSCGAFREEEELTPSGLCPNCLPSLFPVPNQSGIGPGRQKVRDMLTDYRTNRKRKATP